MSQSSIQQTGCAASSRLSEWQCRRETDLPPAVAARNDVRVIHRDGKIVVLEVVAAPQDMDDVIQALDQSAVIDLVRAHPLAMGTEPAGPA